MVNDIKTSDYSAEEHSITEGERRLLRNINENTGPQLYRGCQGLAGKLMRPDWGDSKNDRTNAIE